MKIEKIKKYYDLMERIVHLKNELNLISEFKCPVYKIVEELKDEYVSLNPTDGDGYLEAIKLIGGAKTGLEKTEEYFKMIDEELSLSIKDLESAIEWGLPKSSES
jgi:hypothetical protein